MLTSTVVGSLVLAVVAKGQIMFPGDDVYNHPKDTGRVTNLEVNRANENGQTTRLGTGAESTSDRNIKSIDDNSNSFGFGGNVISDYATGVNLTDCTATNICNNISVTDYPNYAIIKALARMNKYTKSIVKSLAKTSHNSGRSDMDISIRIGGNDDKSFETNVCATKKERSLPRGALNTNGEFMWILNSPAGREEYVQSVDTTLCLGAEQECLSGQFSGHSTRCKQEYSEHKLLALDKNAEEIIIDNFRFPSCCTCQVSSSLEH